MKTQNDNVRENLQHEIIFTAAYDYRADGYDQHGVEALWLVKGAKGTVQFKLFTGWEKSIIGPPDSKWSEFNCKHLVETCVMPADLGYHSFVPHYENQPLITDSCPYLGGRPCYYDGSTMNAEKPFSILVHEGGEKLWEFLDDYYHQIFDLEPEVKTESAGEGKLA